LGNGHFGGFGPCGGLRGFAGLEWRCANGNFRLIAEGADDFLGNLDAPLGRTARQQAGREAGKDFSQGQFNQRAVAIIFRGKSPGGRGLPEFSKGNLNGSLRDLGKNLLHRDEHLGFADIHMAHALHQICRKAGDDGFQRNREGGRQITNRYGGPGSRVGMVAVGARGRKRRPGARLRGAGTDRSGRNWCIGRSLSSFAE
jgi:hypothetical protein